METACGFDSHLRYQFWYIERKYTLKILKSFVPKLGIMRLEDENGQKRTRMEIELITKKEGVIDIIAFHTDLPEQVMQGDVEAAIGLLFLRAVQHVESD